MNSEKLLNKLPQTVSWDCEALSCYVAVPTKRTGLNHCTVNRRFMWVSAKFGTCTVVSVIGTLVEDKMRWFKGEFAHFSCNKCPSYTLDGASAKFSTNSHETDNSVCSHSEAEFMNIEFRLYSGIFRQVKWWFKYSGWTEQEHRNKFCMLRNIPCVWENLRLHKNLG
jgi:hypothetical protein